MENKENKKETKKDSKPLVTDNEVQQELKEKMKKEKFKPYWTWYIFLLINVLVIIGTAACWIVFNYNEQDYWIPTIACNIVALAGLVVFMIFEINHKMNIKITFY